MNREKVIKALECCERTDGEQCKNCPYTDSDICVEEMSKDALALLKELEPVVHCRECKWYERCELNDLMLNHENGFCADGERKERNG